MNKDLSFEHQMKVLLYYYDKLVKENERNPQRRKLLFSFEDIDRMMERSRKYLKEHGGKGPFAK